MKKKNVISLIRYHAEKNESAFRDEAYEIARDFDRAGDTQLAEYILSLMSNVNTFVPQIADSDSAFFERVDLTEDMLLLPDTITRNILGIVNAVERNIGINKFLFQGPPGTGKTEAVKQLARILQRDVFMVNFSSIIDSRLGQTQKNINSLFRDINSFVQPGKLIILFDEIDAIALDRTNQNDLREMGRATSALLKGFDQLNERIVLIATTNLYTLFDKALLRRFDSIIDFSLYTQEDLLEIAEKMLDLYLSKVKLINRDIRLFRKIISLSEPIPYPGDLKNLIKSAVGFSNPHDGTDYFRRLYFTICDHQPENLKQLQEQGFTVREMEILTQKSKSSISRELSGGDENE